MHLNISTRPFFAKLLFISAVCMTARIRYYPPWVIKKILFNSPILTSRNLVLPLDESYQIIKIHYANPKTGIAGRNIFLYVFREENKLRKSIYLAGKIQCGLGGLASGLVPCNHLLQWDFVSSENPCHIE